MANLSHLLIITINLNGLYISINKTIDTECQDGFKYKTKMPTASRRITSAFFKKNCHFVFLGPHTEHMEVPRLRVQSEV